MHRRRCDNVAALSAHVHAVEDPRAVLYVRSVILVIQVVAAAPRDALYGGGERPVDAFPFAYFFVSVKAFVFVEVFVNDYQPRHRTSSDSD